MTALVAGLMVCLSPARPARRGPGGRRFPPPSTTSRNQPSRSALRAGRYHGRSKGWNSGAPMVSSISKRSANLGAAGFRVIGNRYTQEMERRTSKPGGPRFKTVSPRTRPVSPTGPLSTQQRFLLESFAIGVSVHRIKRMRGILLGPGNRDDEIGRLPVQAQVTQSGRTQ